MELKVALKQNYPLLLIILAGAVLRLWCLPCESLWLDESLSVFWATKGFPLMFLYVTSQFQGPLYYVILQAWVGLFGQSEFSLRLPSVIFGTLSIPMIYKLTELFSSKRAGLISALILSLSTFQLYYSQEARPYSLMIFLSMASVFLFFHIRKSRNHRACYAIASILLLYSHLFGIFVIVSENIFAFIKRYLTRDRGLGLRNWVIIQAVLFSSFLPVIAVALFQVLFGDGIIGWIPYPTLQSVAYSFAEYSGYYNYLGTGSPLFALTQATTYLLLSIYAAIIIFYSASVFLGEPKKTEAEKAGFLLIWLSATIILPFILSYALSPIFFVRYVMAASIPFIMLVSIGIGKMDQRYLRLGIILAISLMSLTNTSAYFQETNKEQWRDVAGFMADNASPGDTVLFYKSFVINGPVRYYFKEIPLGTVGLELENESLMADVDIELESLLADTDRIWLVLSHHLYEYRNVEIITNRLSELYDSSQRESFAGIEVILFQNL